MEVGQFRRNSIENFLTPINDYSIIDVELDNDEYEGKPSFIDKALKITNNTSFEVGQSYYFNFKIKQKDKLQTIKVYLRKHFDANRKGEAKEDRTQLIDTFIIPIGTNEYSNFELIFSPNYNYDEIIFELQRTLIDYQQSPSRVIDLTINDLSEMVNVIDYIGHSPLLKIGIQGPTGLLFCINGEEIRMGKSGIYEILNGYKVNSIGFVPKPDSISPGGKDYFILDYQY